MQAGVRRGIELVEHLGHALRDRLLQLHQVGQEPLVDGEFRHSSAFSLSGLSAD